jgi:hypothetical protein
MSFSRPVKESTATMNPGLDFFYGLRWLTNSTDDVRPFHSHGLRCLDQIPICSIAFHIPLPRLPILPLSWLRASRRPSIHSTSRVSSRKLPELAEHGNGEVLRCTAMRVPGELMDETTSWDAADTGRIGTFQPSQGFLTTGASASPFRYSLKSKVR